MKLLKKCRWIKTFLVAILIISMASQPTIACAAGNESGTQGATLTELPGNADNDYLVSGEGWLISIQEINNTATNVPAGSTESEISFDNAWLHDFPSCYYSTDGNSAFRNPEKYAFIGNEDANSSYYRIASPTGNKYTDAVVKNYKAESGRGNFSTEAKLLEKDDAIYNNILTGIKAYSLTSEYVINSAGDTSAAVSAFVKLWQDSGSVDDAINSFVFESDDYWDQVIRYLDLLIIVNAMCGNAWSSEGTDYIQTYLDNLNADGSERFVAVVVAAVANCESINYGTKSLMTLPVYYGYRTGQQPSTFVSWDGSGDWGNVQSTFNDNYTASFKKMSDNNTNGIWWNTGLATSVYPIGSDGSLGFCGYTYIAPTLVPDPDDIIDPTDSSNPPSSDPPTDVVTPTFTVEVTTENEYMQRDTSKPVTATVTIDMGQTDAVQKTFKNIYTSLKNKEAETGETYKTAIEVFVERTFSDGSGVDTSNAVMDSDASG